MKKVIAYLAILGPLMAVGGSGDQKELKRSYEVPTSGDFHLVIENI